MKWGQIQQGRKGIDWSRRNGAVIIWGQKRQNEGAAEKLGEREWHRENRGREWGRGSGAEGMGRTW